MSDFKRNAIPRAKILAEFNQKICRKEPILVGGAGTGLIAKMEEKAGIDMIICSSADVYIMDGIDAAAENYSFGNCNEMTASLAERVAKIVDHTPIIAGVGAADPRRNLKKYVQDLVSIGVSGIANEPGMGSFYRTNFREVMEKSKRGFGLECEMLGHCRENNIFTMGFAYDPEEAKQLAANGVDVVVAKMGDVPYALPNDEGQFDIGKACELCNKMADAALQENPESLVFVSGGGVTSHDILEIMLKNTPAVGFVGRECIEATPVRREVGADIRAFLALELKKSN